MFRRSRPIEPVALFISLDKQPSWDRRYLSLIQSLTERVDVEEVNKARHAIDYLDRHNPAVVIVTDEGILRYETPHPYLSEKLVDYTRGGGKVIIGTRFSVASQLSEVIDRWFHVFWHVPWKCAEAEPGSTYLNMESQRKYLATSHLPVSIHLQSMYLKHVPHSDRLYCRAIELDDGPSVFCHDNTTCQQTPLAITNVGRGLFAYVGDVDHRGDVESIILAICELD
ncbi:hypothetical protein B0A52_07790 [Exophiala mesophila]|uniref:ThuA-like domain-containing protein n=1 Tax=Exophiala mesophila TaxID=212818 RepID=A0A438MVB8_EXOME|nr:hypothetical protein B0A52_07790 [Exophiala mesophila]